MLYGDRLTQLHKTLHVFLVRQLLDQESLFFNLSVSCNLQSDETCQDLSHLLHTCFTEWLIYSSGDMTFIPLFV